MRSLYVVCVHYDYEGFTIRGLYEDRTAAEHAAVALGKDGDWVTVDAYPLNRATEDEEETVLRLPPLGTWCA